MAVREKAGREAGVASNAGIGVTHNDLRLAAGRLSGSELFRVFAGDSGRQSLDHVEAKGQAIADFQIHDLGIAEGGEQSEELHNLLAKGEVRRTEGRVRRILSQYLHVPVPEQLGVHDRLPSSNQQTGDPPVADVLKQLDEPLLVGGEGLLGGYTHDKLQGHAVVTTTARMKPGCHSARKRRWR
jgi:hypothetical protein